MTHSNLVATANPIQAPAPLKRRNPILHAAIATALATSMAAIPKQAVAGPDACAEAGIQALCFGNQSAGISYGVQAELFDSPLFIGDKEYLQVLFRSLSQNILPASGTSGVSLLHGTTNLMQLRMVDGRFSVGTTGDNAHGLVIRNIGLNGSNITMGGVLLVNNNMITTNGRNAIGIFAESGVEVFRGPFGHETDYGAGGDVNVTNTAPIVSSGRGANAFSHGIYAHSYGVYSGLGHAVNVNSTAAYMRTYGGKSNGIFALSEGGYGENGDSGASGSSGSPGGRGGNVTVTGSGLITTEGVNSHGILAISRGGEGGSGGNGNIGNAGNGVFGGHAGIVRVDGTWDIATLLADSYGIFAESLGGEGGEGGNGYTFGDGGSGGGSGDGGQVVVINRGNIETNGARSIGIYAHSVGGFAGGGGNSYGIVAYGGSGESAGHGGQVYARNEGIIYTAGVAAHGLYAQSVGGGGGTGGSGGAIVALGGAGNSGGNGGRVDAVNYNRITVAGANSRGIFAQSIGGGGGDGGSAGGVGAVGGGGGSTSNGGIVAVTNTADITSTAHAIFAESVGGGGGNGGSSSGWFSVGGGGGAGGDSQWVNVFNSGSLRTLENNSSAIFAHSIGGGGGNGGNSVAAGAFGSVAVGGSGAHGGDAADVTVQSFGATITTGRTNGSSGNGSSGIFAQSIGGGGGNGGYAFAGSVGVGASIAVAVGGSADEGGDGKKVTVENSSAITTYGADAHAIFAESIGGGGGNGGFSIAISGSDTVAAAISVGGAGAGGGDAETVSVTTTGQMLSTYGARSYGVLAQSVGGGGGNGGFSIAGTLTAGGIGAAFSLGGSGDKGGIARDVTLESSSNVVTRGNDSHGLFIQSLGGGGGSGGFSIAASISGGAAVDVGFGGSGAGGGSAGQVHVGLLNATTGNITTLGNGSYGLLAQSVGGGGGSGGFSIAGAITASPSAQFSMGGRGGTGSHGNIVTVNTANSVRTFGNDAHGIFAQSVGGGGGNGGFSVSGAITINGGSAGASIGGAGAGGGNANDVTVDSSGTSIETSGARSYGLIAQSVGGGGGDGGFSVAGNISSGPAANFSMGGNGDVGGFGRNVRVNSSTSITTHGAESHALFAQSVGGGGGSGGFSVAGSISANSGSVSASIGGSGAGGGNAGTVFLGNSVIPMTGIITTDGYRSVGILAQSIGGGGGDGGFSVAGGITKGPGARFSLGGSGGLGGNGNLVNVQSNYAIATRGDESHGLFAQSLGGGGGNGGFSVAGSISQDSGTVNVSIGGFGGAGGNGNSVTVANGGDSIYTAGDASHGLFAQSLGGGGGNGGFSVAGSITKKQSVNFSLGGFGGSGGFAQTVTVTSSSDIGTIGNESHAIFAQSVGGGGGNGGFSVAGSIFTDNTGNNKPTVNIAIGGMGGSADAGGIVNVGLEDEYVSGTIITEGNNSHGIFAQSLGGGGGNGGFSVAGGFSRSPTATFSVGGFGGHGSDGKQVNVFTASDITTYGSDAHGVFAQSLGGGGGNGGFSVAGSATTATTGVNASVGGFGGGGGRADTVTVNNRGSITTHGMNSYGVYAQSVGGGGGNGGFSIAGSLSAAPTGQSNSKGPKNINFSVGGFGGNGDVGGNVFVTNNGGIDTSGASSHGVFAHSVGGGGGNGGFAGSGSLGLVTGNSTTTRASIAASVGGFGGNGNNGGTVDVDNFDSIITRGLESRGIYAFSIGGGGGDGGASYAINTAFGKPNTGNGLNVEFSVGGFGGNGNDGALVDVTNDGNIGTLGMRADAIYAQSIGGGGGDGGAAQAVSLDFTRDGYGEPKTKPGTEWNFVAAVGGFGGMGNDGGVVNVTNHGSLETHGINARGIVAQSIGGGGGNGGAGINGTSQAEFDEVTGLLDLKDKNVLDVRNWSVLVGGNGGANGNGLEVTVRNTGTIDTFGLASTAIFAQSVGGGGGEAQNFATATGQGGTSGIGINSRVGLGGAGGAAGNGAAVVVESSGRIETRGHDSHGIFAQSVGGGGGVAGNVDRALANGLGPIPSLNVGLGLAFGQAGGGGGNGGAVTVTSSNNIVTNGDGSFGIFAQSVAGGGGLAGGLGNSGTPADPVTTLQNFAGSVGGAGTAAIVTVNHTGNIGIFGDQADGIFAQSSAGTGAASAVNVTLSGMINAGGFDANGIRAQSHGGSASGNIGVTVSAGSIRGGTGTGAAISIVDGATNTVTNRGTLGDSTELTRFAIRGTGGNEGVSNFGGIAGNIDLGAGNNTFVNQTTGTFISGTNATLGASGTLTNHGTWSIGNLGSVSTTAVQGNITQSSTGRMIVDLDHSAGTADRVTATGTATLAGSVAVNDINTPNTEEIRPGTLHVVLVTAPSISASTLTLDVVQRPIVQYRLASTSSTLALDVTTDFSLAANGIALSPNQAALGQYVNAVQMAGSSPELRPLITHLLAQNDSAGIVSTYEQLNPDNYTNTVAGSLANGQQFGDALLSCKSRDGDFHFTSERQCGWFGISLNEQKQDATSTANGFERSGSVLAGGIQGAMSEHWHLGLGAAFNTDSVVAKNSTSGDGAISKGESVQAGAVLKGNFGDFTLAWSIATSQGEYDVTRRALDGSFAVSEQSISLLGAQLRAAYAFDLHRWYWRPMVDVNVTDVYHGAFSETGAGAYNLSVEAGHDRFVSLQPQIETGYDMPIRDGGLARWYVRLGMTRYVSGASMDVTASLAVAPVGAGAFTVSQALDKRAGDIAVGVDIFTSQGVVLRAGYTGQVSSHGANHGGTIKVSLPFK